MSVENLFYRSIFPCQQNSSNNNLPLTEKWSSRLFSDVATVQTCQGTTGAPAGQKERYRCFFPGTDSGKRCGDGRNRGHCQEWPNLHPDWSSDSSLHRPDSAPPLWWNKERDKTGKKRRTVNTGPTDQTMFSASTVLRKLTKRVLPREPHPRGVSVFMKRRVWTKVPSGEFPQG